VEFWGEWPGASPEQILGLFAALILGGLIGLERLFGKHPAGLHTTALVALGSAAFVIAGTLIGDESGPARVAGQVVTGVGFLCAGVILHQGATVRGLNTAATVWCSSAVGVLAGLGFPLWAALVAALVIVTNVALQFCERHLANSQQPDK
jgi:putative Mg2+ transporter-C (MgtC) family protein